MKIGSLLLLNFFLTILVFSQNISYNNTENPGNHIDKSNKKESLNKEEVQAKIVLAQNLIEAVYEYINENKLSSRNYAEKIAEECRNNISKEKSLKKIIKELARGATKLLRICSKEYVEYDFPQDLLDAFNADMTTSEICKHIEQCAREFTEMVNTIRKEAEEKASFAESIQDLMASLQMYNNILQEIVLGLNDYTKQSKAYSCFYFTLSKLGICKKSSPLEIISFVAPNFQQLIALLQQAMIDISLISSQKDSGADEIVNSTFNLCILSYSIIKMLFESNFKFVPDEETMSSYREKTKNILEKYSKKTNNNYLKAMSMMAQELSKQKKTFLIPLHKYVYQKIYGYIHDTTEFNTFAKVLKSVFKPKLLCMATLVASIQSYFSSFVINPKIIKSFFDFAESEHKKSKRTSIDELDSTLLSSDKIEPKDSVVKSGDKSPNKKLSDLFESSYEESINSLPRKLSQINLTKSDVEKMLNEYSKLEKWPEPVKDNFREKILSLYPERVNPIKESFSNTGFLFTKGSGLALELSSNVATGIYKGINELINEIKIERTKHSAENEKNMRASADYPYKLKFALLQEQNNIYESALKSIHRVKVTVDDFSRSCYNEKRIWMGRLVGATILSGGMHYAAAKLEESTGILASIIGIFKQFNNYMLDKEKSQFDISSGNKKKHSEYNLDSKVFDPLRDRGALRWFDEVIKRIKNPYLDSGKHFSRAICLSGPSGAGKTLLAKAFAQSITDLSAADNVHFVYIEPRHLFMSMGGDGKQGGGDQPDVLQQLCTLIEDNSSRSNVFVIYFDEFHLFFTDKSGRPDHSKHADFLKLFSDLKEKQANTTGGVYVVISTNRPEYVPSDIFDNPGRVDSIIYIDYPDFNERKILIESYLKKVGIPFKDVDINYISRILEGKEVSQGNVIKILQYSIALSRSKRKVINTEFVYEAVNSVSRKISKCDMSRICESSINSISSYYASVMAITSLFKEDEHRFIDTITIYPVHGGIDPDHVDNMHLRPKKLNKQFGQMFILEKDSNIPLISLRRAILDVMLHIIGKTYCIKQKLDIPTQAWKDVSEAHRIAARYFALRYDIDPEKWALLSEKDHPLSPKINKLASRLLDSCVKELDKILSNSHMKESVESISKLVKSKKTLQLNEALKDKTVENAASNLKDEFYDSVRKILEDFENIDTVNQFELT
jgi:SpoVK/Ycf46/Vps4 family AAA+-type ATPase